MTEEVEKHIGDTFAGNGTAGEVRRKGGKVR